MKKKVFLTLTLTIPLIVACSSYGPTPKLYTQFEKASLKTRVAEKYEWQLEEIGNEFSYVFDFDHSQTEGKPNHFLRVFYNNKQVYEEITEQDYLIDSAFSDNDCSYYVCTQFDKKVEHTSLSCLVIDKAGQSYRFSLPYNNYCSGACTDGSFCYFLLNERVENASRYLYKTDLHGNFIESNTVSDRFNQLHFVNNSIFTVSWTYKYDTKDDSLECVLTQVWKLDSNGTADEVLNIEGQADCIDFNHLSGYSHTTNDNKYTFYYCSGDQVAILFDYTLPDDLSYYYQGTQNYGEDLIMVFSAYRKNMAKDIYSRHVFIYYSGSTQKLSSFCPNKNFQSVIFRNEKVFYGTYSNKADNKMDNGSFRTFKL